MGEKENTRQLLKGFKMANIHFHFLSDDLEKLYTKSKFFDLFDVAALSIYSGNHIGDEFNTIMKKGGHVHVESADMLIPVDKKNRPFWRTTVSEKASKCSWVESKKQPYSHHQLFRVEKELSIANSTQA